MKEGATTVRVASRVPHHSSSLLTTWLHIKPEAIGSATTFGQKRDDLFVKGHVPRIVLGLLWGGALAKQLSKLTFQSSSSNLLFFPVCRCLRK